MHELLQAIGIIAIFLAVIGVVVSYINLCVTINATHEGLLEILAHIRQEDDE